MRFFIAPIIAISCLLAGTAGRAGAGEYEELKKDTRFLESEFKLARTDGIYFVINLKEKTVYLKARGTSYREFPIQGVKLWGKDARPEPHKLLQRSALFQPKREKIKPPPPKEETGVSNEAEETESAEDAAKPGAFELEALELKDMPRSFTLRLDGGVVISVKPASEGRIFQYVGDAFFQLKWYIVKPFATLWNAIRGRPYSAVYVKLRDADAQSLYWSFPEGTEAVIYYP